MNELYQKQLSAYIEKETKADDMETVLADVDGRNSNLGCLRRHGDIPCLCSKLRDRSYLVEHCRSIPLADVMAMQFFSRYNLNNQKRFIKNNIPAVLKYRQY
jgi:hypothetical protein